MLQPETSLKNPEDLCLALIRGFEKKASHNKNESMLCFLTSMGGALLVPVFITLGPSIGESLSCPGVNLWLGKVFPSLLSVCVALSTGWLQLRKPQQLWSLYRTSQRELEDNLYKYRFSTGDYANTESAERVLVEKIAKIALETHYSWVSIVPNPENMR